MGIKGLEGLREDYIAYLARDLKLRWADDIVMVDTPFSLPDGTVLQVGVRYDPEGQDSQLVVSDCAAVADFFFHSGHGFMDPPGLVGRIEERVGYYGAHLVGEVIELRTPLAQLPDAINRVAQAVIAAAALWEQPNPVPSRAQEAHADSAKERV